MTKYWLILAPRGVAIKEYNNKNKETKISQYQDSGIYQVIFVPEFKRIQHPFMQDTKIN